VTRVVLSLLALVLLAGCGSDERVAPDIFFTNAARTIDCHASLPRRTVGCKAPSGMAAILDEHGKAQIVYVGQTSFPDVVTIPGPPVSMEAERAFLRQALRQHKAVGSAYDGGQLGLGSESCRFGPRAIQCWNGDGQGFIASNQGVVRFMTAQPLEPAS
jgi:hypothetical protein